LKFSGVDEVSVSNCHFEDSVVSGDGGIIHINQLNGKFLIDNSTFLSGYSTNGQAGAIYYQESSTENPHLEIKNSKFINNSAVGGNSKQIYLNILNSEVRFLKNELSLDNQSALNTGGC
jgi:hypothetical protein